MKRSVLAVLLAAALTGLAAPLAAASHVRVVLDLSASMQQNDQKRLAVLSTMLLYDLAQPNPTLGDSFEVIPFEKTWSWTDPAQPPVSTRARIRARAGDREGFRRELQALAYDSDSTFFYPGLKAAVDDLEREPGGAYDVRAVVLVTDGVPGPRQYELERMRSELAPRIEKSGIRLFVLAFGGEADKNQGFFGELLRSSQGSSLGQSFVDARGDQLLELMLRIFSNGFGFSPDASRPLPGTGTLDLEGGTTPERVAVVVFSPQPQALPRLRLAPPPNGSVNSPEGVQSAGEGGGGYSLAWVLSPNPGDYVLDSDAIPGSVAVLRPTRLELEILPGPGHKQAERALAGVPFPLQVLIRSPTGAQGDPGAVDLSFRALGRRLSSGTGAAAYAWQGRIGAPPAGSGTVTSRGRVYDIVVELQEDPETPGEIYAGSLEVEARRGGAVVGALAGSRAPRIEVHPSVAIAPVPLAGYAAATVLGRRQEGCTEFELQLTAGRLPHPDRPQYPIRAALRPSDPAVVNRELHEATFSLDGLPLEIEGQPAAHPGEWNRGRALSETELLGRHKICVRVGKPKTGNAAAALDLAVAFDFLEVPYDDFHVVQPFTLKLRVAPPGFFEKWRALLFTVAALFAVLALVWFLRDRPAFPSDLLYTVGREDAGALPQAAPLPEQSGVTRLLGWVTESAVIAPGEERLLGHVRPVDGELFKLRPARGVSVEPVGREEAPSVRRGLATLAIHRTYRLRSGNGSYLFRLEYR